MRQGAGLLLVVAAMGVLFLAVSELRSKDYLACIVLVLTGLSLMRAGTELLRPGDV